MIVILISSQDMLSLYVKSTELNAKYQSFINSNSVFANEIASYKH